MAYAVPIITALTAAGGTYAAIRASKAPDVAKPPLPATQDTAANAANQQAALMRQRRGVLANIFGGQQQPVAKSALGN